MSAPVATVWIISTAQTACANCGTHLSPGDHVLWLPEKAMGANNLCRADGEDLNPYPGPSYWQVREERLRQIQEERSKGRRATHVR